MTDGRPRVMGARGRAVRWLGLLLVLALWMPAVATAEPPCQGKRALDPRAGRLQVLDLQVTRQGIAGTVRNSGSDTALGVMVWLNYYLGQRGGILAQQCIPVGDLAAGEERPFLATPIAEADRAEAWNYAADAVGWR